MMLSNKADQLGSPLDEFGVKNWSIATTPLPLFIRAHSFLPSHKFLANKR
jgi:hypothetical protein